MWPLDAANTKNTSYGFPPKFAIESFCVKWTSREGVVKKTQNPKGFADADFTKTQNPKGFCGCWLHQGLWKNTCPFTVRHVVSWWVLAFALAKVGMALGDFVLAMMYFNQTLGPSFALGRGRTVIFFRVRFLFRPGGNVGFGHNKVAKQSFFFCLFFWGDYGYTWSKDIGQTMVKELGM